jgi:hypothetical protein
VNVTSTCLDVLHERHVGTGRSAEVVDGELRLVEEPARGVEAYLPTSHLSTCTLAVGVIHGVLLRWKGLAGADSWSARQEHLCAFLPAQLLRAEKTPHD